MQRRYAMRDNERQLQGGGQRGQYRRDFDDEAAQRDFAGYGQEDDYGMQASRERGEWQADWSESGRARGDDPRYERNERYERYGSGSRESRESRYGNPRELDAQGYSREAYGRAQGGMHGHEGYGARGGYRDDFGNDFGNDMERGYGQQHRFGGGQWQGQRGAGQGESGAAYGAYGAYGGQGAYGAQGMHGMQGAHSGSGMDMRNRQGPKGYSRTDERIREDVCERLCMAHQLEVEDVSVQVKDGRVELQGNVPQRWMKHAVEDVVEQCFGVHDVENRIRTQSQTSQHSQGDSQRGASASQRSPGQTTTTSTSSATGSTGSSSGTLNDGKHH